MSITGCPDQGPERLSVAAGQAGGAPRAVEPLPSGLLLVEDNPGDVALFQEAFQESGENLSIAVAGQVDEAIALLARSARPPALIVLDLHLPGKNGKALLRHLKEHGGFKDLIIVVFSSSTWPKDIEECLALGAHHYRVKPHDWNGYLQLVTFILGLLNGAPAQPEAAR